MTDATTPPTAPAPSPAARLAAEKRAAAPVSGRMRIRPQLLVSRAKDVRVRLTLTQEEVAAAIGVSPLTVMDAEHGRGARLVVAVALARFYGCTLDDLWPVAEQPAAGGPAAEGNP